MVKSLIKRILNKYKCIDEEMLRILNAIILLILQNLIVKFLNQTVQAYKVNQAL